MSGVRKVGLEEELLLVDPVTGALANTSRQVLHEARRARLTRAAGSEESDPELEAELLLHMVEIQTEPHADLTDIDRELREARTMAIKAAQASDVAPAAVGMAPVVDADPVPSRGARYQRIVTEFGDTGRTAETLGMHVHVDVHDDEEAVRVVDGIRDWLPLVTALAANSPYSHNRDSGHASWRHVTWHRWPAAGPSEPYGSVAACRRATQALIDSGAALDPGMLYLDARLAASYPTVEVRVADTCTEIDDALLVEALARALVTTAAAGGMEHTPARSDLLRAAFWRAARSGLGDTLWHPERDTLVPAYDALGAMVDRVRPALGEAGDESLVDTGLVRLSQVGGGATRQRQAFERTGSLTGVVADLVERSQPGDGG